MYLVMEPSDTDLIGLETVTADNKNLGKVIAIDIKKKNHYFIVLKKGLLKDEEYHIPSNAITASLPRADRISYVVLSKPVCSFIFYKVQ